MRRSAFLSLAALAGCAARHAAIRPFASAQRGVRIVALGDSLAFGIGASSPEKAFIFRAYQRVREQRPASEIDNIAMPGSTARDVLRLQVPRLVKKSYDVILICVGANDAVRHVPAAAFAASYARVVAAVRRQQPRARVVCCGVPNVGISPLFTGFDHDVVTQLARTDDAAIRGAARATGASFVDLFAVTSRAHNDAARFLSDDRFHPSDAGYAKLADALAPALLRAADASARLPR